MTRQDDTTWPPAPDLVPGVGSGARTPTSDPDPGNNAASTGDPLSISADLMLSKSVTPEVVHPGDTITYTLAVTNSGPMQADNVVVTDYLPTSVSLLEADISVPGACLGTATLTCNTGHMNPGDAVTVTVYAKLDPDVPEHTVVKNDASVFSDDFDPNLLDNYASVSNVSNYPSIEDKIQVFLPIFIKD